ncbi:MAG TPA: ABC transporter ATP-binding protein [Bacillota bacterium]|nr:ABC transporter ATP-binding protein [Bacillota bacterium]
MRQPASKRSYLRDILIGTLQRHVGATIVLLSAVIAGAFINVWPSLVLRATIDGPLLARTGNVWYYALLYLGAVVLIGLVDLVREYGATILGQRLLLAVRSRMLGRLQILPMSYYLNVPAGETISRLTADVDAVNRLFSAGLVSAGADLLKIFGFLAAIFALSRPLGLLALGSLPLVFVVTNHFRKNIYLRQLVIRKRVSDINTYIQETYAGMKVIKTYGKEDFFSDKFEPILEEHRLAMNANSIYDAWFPCVTQTVRAVVIALALYLAAGQNYGPLALGLSLGTLAGVTDLFIRLFEPIEAISSEIQTIQQAFAGLNRIEQFFATETEPPERFSSAATWDGKRSDILVQDVHFAYQGADNVLLGASLQASAGSKIAIAGRTGSGKTTLMHLMAGLYPVGSGQIRIGGVDPYAMMPSERRRLIGIVPQTVHIFHGTVHENITLRDSAISKEQTEQSLRTVGLWEAICQLPEGVDALLGEGAARLSFGQSQLLSLARAIVTDPPVLLLDELTSGLDSLTERFVLKAIREVSQGRTIVTISHRLSGIIDAETVHIMERGKIMESGSPTELARKEGWYAIYKRLEDRGWRIS